MKIKDKLIFDINLVPFDNLVQFEDVFQKHTFSNLEFRGNTQNCNNAVKN